MKISKLAPQKDWNFLGSVRPKKREEICEAYLEFLEGWGGLGKNPFCGGGMAILWNYILFLFVIYILNSNCNER